MTPSGSRDRGHVLRARARLVSRNQCVTGRGFVGSVIPDPDEVPTVEEETLDVDPAATDPCDGGSIKSAPEYSVVERRQKAQRPEPQLAIRFDAKEYAVLEWNIDSPRRREEDDTLDLLECLDPDDLALTDEVDATANEDDHAGGFNPYDNSTKKRSE